MMPDHNYYSARTVKVATSGLRDAAGNWRDHANTMATVEQTAAGLHLGVSAFTVIIDGPVGIGTATALQSAYDAEYQKLTGLFKEAVPQFHAMAKALKENADWYDDVDADSAQSFDGIAKGDWPH
jgi:hypothetical protein